MLHTGFLRRFVESFRARGIRGTANRAMESMRSRYDNLATYVAERTFDWRYGTNTAQIVPMEELDIPCGNRASGRMYEAAQARPFLQLLCLLNFDHDSNFVDFGCGKGRALILAAEYGFARIVGVEFASNLCKIASQNIAIFKRRSGRGSKIEIINHDAAVYPIRANDNVFFMYNPFDADIMGAVIDNILESVAAYPRQVFLVYLNPLCRDVIERKREFCLVANHLFCRSRFMVYSNGPLSKTRDQA